MSRYRLAGAVGAVLVPGFSEKWALMSRYRLEGAVGAVLVPRFSEEWALKLKLLALAHVSLYTLFPFLK